MAWEKRKSIDKATIDDFTNTFTVSRISEADSLIIHQWLIKQKLLWDGARYPCPTCGNRLVLYGHTDKEFGRYVCKKHEFSVLHNSFFANSKIEIQNHLVFMRPFLLGDSLKR